MSSYDYVRIQDSGTSGVDVVRFSNISSAADVYATQVGNDLYVTSASDIADTTHDSGALFVGWFDGYKTIESFVTANGDAFTIN